MAVGSAVQLGLGAEQDELTELRVRGGWRSAAYRAWGFGRAPGHGNKENRKNCQKTNEEGRHHATSFPKALRSPSPAGKMPGCPDR